MTTSTPATIGSRLAYDAIVVGARAAGAATAMLLGRAGQRVLLVDRAVYGADTLSTHALMRGGVLQLRRWGLLDDVQRAGTPAIRRTKFHYGDEIVDIEIADQYGVGELYAPRRTVLDALLVDAAWDTGVDVVHRVRVTGLRRDGEERVVGVTAQIDGGGEAVADAGIVIGADGTGSTVAKLVGAGNSHCRSDASAYIYGYFGGFPDDLYDWHFRPGVMAGVIPTNGDVANVSIGIPPSRFASEARAMGVERGFHAVLGEAAPEIAAQLRGAVPVGRFRSFPGRPGHLRRACGPGWALVGDAGYFKDPITADGITDALRDAELLTRSLLTNGNAAAYEATRDVFSRPLLDTTTAVASYAWDLQELMRLHRELKAATDEELMLLSGLDAALAA